LYRIFNGGLPFIRLASGRLVVEYFFIRFAVGGMNRLLGKLSS
jgi:hypothetical protein